MSKQEWLKLSKELGITTIGWNNHRDEIIIKIGENIRQTAKPEEIVDYRISKKLNFNNKKKGKHYIKIHYKNEFFPNNFQWMTIKESISWKVKEDVIKLVKYNKGEKYEEDNL